ncbi:adenosine deaminase [Brachybacterium sp. J144]|uniref:adenosine deaminase n=1 Tax=Brachybacterium sp. J144 TaxID=3116487 RepID=UPI002E77889B|nr:adenosine deaminase [Brachybacterium sp. J144]MEE1650707.1 adenosine deaminase [Brachybacterium sp. J144]
MSLTPAQIRSLPTAVLHDHLDGGLRPDTVLALSAELGIEPPARTAPEVADWFHDAADSGSLPRYLATFDRTLALMQRPEDLRRIAREFVEDMAADGVVYAETRWAPHQHLERGLTLEEAVEAVQAGIEEGMAAASDAGTPILAGQLLCYLRHLEPTEDLVRLADAHRDRGVWGVDLAGPEAGYPASRFRAVFELACSLGVRVTIHAGEGDGPASIADALDCGAERIGHGVRIAEDLGGDDAGAEAGGAGAVAARVLAHGICLEVCPSSNLQTGIAATIAEHPVPRLDAAGFRLAVSSDNRLMSRTSTSRELTLVAEACDWSVHDLERVTLTALDAGFAPAAAREALRRQVVVPAYAPAR